MKRLMITLAMGATLTLLTGCPPQIDGTELGALAWTLFNSVSGAA